MTSELQNLFNQAVEAQSQGKDLEALAVYKAINAQGFTSPSIELNKSLIFEKQEDWGRALTAAEKAQHLARSPWLAEENIERMQKEVGSNRAYAIGSLGEMTGELSKIMRPEESILGASLLMGVFLIARALGFRHRGYNVAVLLASLLIIFSIMAFSVDKTAYIISDAELRPLPIEESVSKFYVGKGAKVVVMREKGKFTQVERPGDFSGWVSVEALKE